MRTPVELVEQYVFEIYNKQRVELIHEICGDPVIRHEAGNTVALSRNQQIERIRADLASNQPTFEVTNLSGNEEFATLTWNAIRLSTGERLCGIEVFKATAGLITDVWNSNYFEGSWS
ncbi:hypothetical protein CJ179_43735 [Rhodococcus sp. ACS1]|uniref:SnoaL-like domain-containing protein n=1 Tax=Rhodococcus koreensis TaxID=99653 RepID=A0A1H4V3F9_9NOCA|nr:MULTISPECIES: hypothetical protein [Rhodococcus]PBC36870.1 hypothetical protein CJ179_43735 [Rhodococcus sp. ACS1]QSE81410.1 hypothetical protein JWS14_20780 [Rhodococcus koreensis]SEC75443.1 hypothetical protein SAMN04490239_5322 [Rhodococcus koreensis]